MDPLQSTHADRRNAQESAGEIVDLLTKAVRGSVEAGNRRRAEYSSDASNYRVVPEVVVFPRDVDDVLAVVEIARREAVPLTARGAGTSVAGNSIGPGIVMDLSRSMNRILELDQDARTATVEPGMVLGTLQSAAQPYALRFGPDPSTWARCTIGGMIGNNACGSHSLVYGKTADNVIELDMVDGYGRRFTAAQDLSVVPGLTGFAASNLAVARTEFGRFGRQVSGYSLEHLLPERGHDLAKALVGAEGTLGVVLGATVRLVDVPSESVLVVLGYSSMHAAADAVPALLAHRPAAIEGLDARLVGTVREKSGVGAVAQLPRGAGWLLVEMTGETAAAAAHAAKGLVRDSEAISSRILSGGPDARSIWRIREDGAGLAGRTASGRQAWPGFEDAAVPPENLGQYLREFDALLDEYDVEGMPYGHFGDGCVHVRLDIPLQHDGLVLRPLMEDAARLVARYGGSISGEHGDGRARSELLPLMYSPAAMTAFAQFKALFDPRHLLNPGVLVAPAAIDVDLRRPVALPLLSSTGFSFNEDGGDFTAAVHRCVGVGKCRADNSASGGFMCPSYLATSDEKDTTRGRARVLQEMANGSLVNGWTATEVHDALDLCLSCKACSSDCPAGVDMAMYKSEVLHRSYQGKLRPVTHYLLGWLPRWARLATLFSPIVNALLSVRIFEKLVLAAGGMDSRRSIPRFARKAFHASRRTRSRVHPSSKKVVLWVDSFSDNFSPAIAESAVAVLEASGYDVIVPERPVCCGLTWITTGQLTAARRMLTGVLDDFFPFAEADVPILGLEPSCTAVLRGDLRELLPDDPRSSVVSKATYTLAELLSAPAPVGPNSPLPPGILDGVDAVAQPHCHQHAVMGFSADAKLLASLGARVTALSGCCGLAGNFGMEKGHYDVSVAVAEQSLLPALAAAPAGTVFLADGFSCRTQADQLAGASGVHLAQLLSARLKASGVSEPAAGSDPVP